MTTLTFRSWRDGTYIPLAEILLVLGPLILKLKWRLEIEEAAPESSAEALYEIPSSSLLACLDLVHLVTPDIQIIDGKIFGYDASGRSTLSIGAIRGDDWDIETNDAEILRVVARAYPEAKDIELLG